MQVGGLYDVKFQTCDETLKDENSMTPWINLRTSKQKVCIMDSIHVVPKTGPIYLVLAVGRPLKAATCN